MMVPTKDHNLCFGDADVEAIGCTERLHGVQQLLQSLCRRREQGNVTGVEQAGIAFAPTLNPSRRLPFPIFPQRRLGKPSGAA